MNLGELFETLDLHKDFPERLNYELIKCALDFEAMFTKQYYEATDESAKKWYNSIISRIKEARELYILTRLTDRLTTQSNINKSIGSSRDFFMHSDFEKFLKKYNDLIKTPEKERRPRNPVDYTATGRSSHRYAAWRGAVLLRDNFACAYCGDQYGPLEAHHIKPFANNEELACDIKNGITFCQLCHKEFHSRFGNDAGIDELNIFLRGEVSE